MELVHKFAATTLVVHIFCIIRASFLLGRGFFIILAVFGTWQRLIQDISRALHCYFAIV
jgi:hypothetical protein